MTKFIVGRVYNHCTTCNPWYGRGWKCVYVTKRGWGLLIQADELIPPKLDLFIEGVWELGDKKDFCIYPLVTGDQMDYMRD